MRSVPLALSAFLLLTFCACTPRDPKREMPGRLLWAWERQEDLRFVDPGEFGVAFLAQTLTLRSDEVVNQPRRQPLELAAGTYLIAVTRIESRSATFSDQQRKNITLQIVKTLELPNVKGVQVDFDALNSERAAYADLLSEIGKSLPEGFPLTITALTSWCSGDRWLKGLPIDDAIPMLFDTGPDAAEISARLARGEDWNEPVCRNSYGVSLDAPQPAGLRPNRRIYYFKSSPWREHDLEKIKNLHEN